MSRCQMAIKTAPIASYQVTPQVAVVAAVLVVVVCALAVGRARCYIPAHRDIVVGAGVDHGCPSVKYG